MSEVLSQQERLQAIAEKRKRQAEIENKKRQLEDDRRQLQHLKSKALRERWLLDGAPSAGSVEDEAKNQLQEDEAKTKGLEETILRLEQELEELETGVSATSTKENLADAAQQEETKPVENMVTGDSIQAMYSVEITIEKDRITGETKVLSTNRLLPKDLSYQGVKVYEDEQKVVHEVRGTDGPLTNGVHQLSLSEVEELIHKADEVTMSDNSIAMPQRKVEADEKLEAGMEQVGVTPVKEITGVEAKPSPAAPQTGVNDASVEKPVTMVFMGYQDVEDEDETKKLLGVESTTVKAELVVIEDGENKNEAKEEQAPPNGGPAESEQAQEEKGKEVEPEAEATEIKSKEKQPCKCCSIM